MIERKTLESATIIHADGREEKEYCPSMNLINKYLDEPSNFVRDMLIKGELCKKLGPIEDEEEKLGIEVITLLKVINCDEIVEKTKDLFLYHKSEYLTIDLKNKCVRDYNFDSPYYFSDYGKLWAVTKEELSNE